MRFFEFNDFEYYALIGANTEEQAIEHYDEFICEVSEDDGTPTELTTEQAKEKLIDACEYEVEKISEIKLFEECLSKDEPCIVLIEGGLI